MRIAVNTRFLLPDKLEGFGVFTHETLKRLVTANPQHEFIFLFDRPYDKRFLYADNVIPEVVFPQARHPFLWYSWFEWALPKVFKRYQPDIFLSPDGYLSLSSNVKSVPVIHDLAFEHYPKAVPFLTRHYYRYFFPRFAARADAIATVSSYSKQDLIQQYQVPPNKISVVYNGANENFRPLSNEEKSEVKARLTQGYDYFIYVGAIHHRKNIPNLLRAFDLFKQQTGSPVKLLVAGRKAWGNQQLNELHKSLNHYKAIQFTGTLNQSEVARCVGAALALTYISYFEGFGIPLLEAMQCQVPVITSNTSSLPEVAGEAGLLNQPDDVEGIANSMVALTKDNDLRDRLKVNARKQAGNFSWENTADRLWHVLEKTANS